MKFFTQSLVAVFVFLFLFGCAAKQMSTLPEFEAKIFDAGVYESKVDNFLILFDASSSMHEKYNGNKKFNIARQIVSRMNDTIPELGQTAGLRSFGHSPEVSKKTVKLFHGMEKYFSHTLENNFEKIKKAGGFSPMDRAMNASSGDLEGLSGDMNAVIMVTDGRVPAGNVITAAKALKGQYGDTICFYPILVGDAEEGEAILKEIEKTGKCGFYSNADDLLTSDSMADFVEKVFLNKKAMASAPAPAPAPTLMKKDSDKDGVYDEDDQCPGTPMGADVNPVGCWILDNVLFDFDKDVIKAEAYPLLDNVKKILEQNPALSVDLHGHCDNVGTSDYNMDLSMRRAHAVKKHLIGKGILKNRMTTKGFGFTKPVALNGTAAGRALNRRVEIHPY